ncbi:alpha/beta hydrolase-fold protein [Microbulbifer sp. EKSA005]|uniref:alpha/beta hydrolase-fold protein n=1 Tax=Microbulbifer sp. EKSA005 TaxID=3243364 RepID=UPI0040436DB3
MKGKFIAILIAAVWSLTAQSNELTIGERKVIVSQTLEERREYWISLPTSFKEGGYKDYPVLYLLDADFNSFFHVFTGMVRQLSSDATPVIPEMIVVGIVSQERVRDSSPTRSLTEYGGRKNQALSNTGGADQFLEFLREELIPEINAEYPTSGYQILAGYSFTGLPVIHSLYSSPEDFNAYIAIDPSMWWDEQIMLKRYSEFLQGKSTEKRRLFISTSKRVEGVYPDENYVAEFIRLLNEKPKKGLYVDSVTYGTEENHHTMPVISFYRGLRSIFDGYMIDDQARFRPAVNVKNHFEQFSRKLGGTFMLREDVISFFGYDRLYNDQFGIDVDKAIEFFELNTQFYPGSYKTWDSLAEAYMVKGKKELAIDCYRKSLLINPDNENAKSRMSELLIF